MTEGGPDERLGGIVLADPVAGRCVDGPVPASWPPGAWWPPDAARQADPYAEPRLARLTVRTGTGSVRSARDMACKHLLDHGLRHLIDDTVIVVGELLTNAVTHAAPRVGLHRPVRPVQVILICRPAGVLVMVTDPDADPPAPVSEAGRSLFAESGRGLHIVQALAGRWGWTPLVGGGKAVWALIGDGPGL